MKKILIIVSSIVVAFTIFACIVLNSNSSNDTLYLLNWGEYIDEGLFDTFEAETGIKVIQETVTSSETMYQKISAGTTAYDVAIPGDYMVTKLYNEGYLYEIDVNNPEYEYLNNYETMFNDKLTALREQNMKETMTYTMPYFWGAYAMIYSTQHEDTADVVKTNGFKALYNKSLYKENVKVGMYNTARWAVASYLMANDKNPNDESVSQSEIVNGLKSASFDVWGDDQLKRKTATGDLDLCFTQLGDFFDAVYLSLDEGMGGSVGLDALNFNVYVPETTSAFFDGMVIPTTSKNQTAANMFINFMMNPDNAFDNALAIGYSPTLKSVIQMFKDNPDEEYFSDDNIVVTVGDLTAKYEFYLDPLCKATNVTQFEPKESAYMTLCETMVNQAKGSFDSDSNAGTVLCIILLTCIVGGAAGYVCYVVIKLNRRKKQEAQLTN